MSNIINADNGVVSGIAGIKYSADTSGVLVLQTNGTTAITINADQTVLFSGSVVFTSGAFTNLSYTGTLTGGTGVVNLGSGQFYKDSSGNVGIGTATPSYSLEVYNAANVEQVWNASGTVKLYAQANTSNANGTFGTLTAHPLLFITSGSERARISSAGNLAIGTSLTPSLLTVSPAGVPAAAYSLATFSMPANGSTLNIQSASGGGQYMYTSVAGDTILRTDSNSMCFATASTFKFGTPSAEWMRLDSSGNLLVGQTTAYGRLTLQSFASTPLTTLTIGDLATPATAVGIYLRSNGTSPCVISTAGAPLAFAGGASGSPEWMRIAASGSVLIGVTTNTGNIGKIFNNSGYALALETIPNDVGYYEGNCKRISATLGNTGDPALGYVLLAKAYNGTAKGVSSFTGTISKRRGAPYAGCILADCQISAGSGYVQNLGFGVNFGPTSSWNIVTCVYGGVLYVAVRSSTSLSASTVTIDGIYTDDFTPILVSDGSVSSVTVINTF